MATGRRQRGKAISFPSLLRVIDGREMDGRVLSNRFYGTREKGLVGSLGRVSRNPIIRTRKESKKEKKKQEGWGTVSHFVRIFPSRPHTPSSPDHWQGMVWEGMEMWMGLLVSFPILSSLFPICSLPFLSPLYLTLHSRDYEREKRVRWKKRW